MRKQWFEKRVERVEDDILEPSFKETKQSKAVWQMELISCLRISGDAVCRSPKALAVFNKYGKLIEYYRYTWEEVGDAENGPSVQEGLMRIEPSRWTRKVRHLHLPKHS